MESANQDLKKELFVQERKANPDVAYEQATFVVSDDDLKKGKDSVLGQMKA